MRIATWNLDHASNSKRPISLQIEKILHIAPDIIILTETTDAVSLKPYGYEVAYPEMRNGYGKFCVGIWSKLPIKSRPQIGEAMLSACAEIDTTFGPLRIYGTIIPYHAYKGFDGTSSVWEEHYKAIRKQGEDWKSLSIGAPLIVAGDFNQTRDGSSHSYGTRYGRNQLSDVLHGCDLACITEENFGMTGKLKPDPAKGVPRNNIDHICVSKDAFSVIEAWAWDHFTEDGAYLSDHNGVYVDLTVTK